MGLLTLGTNILRHGLFVYNRLIKSVASCQIVAVKAVACQDSAGDVASQSAVTVNIYRFALGDFGNPLTERVQRNMHKSVDSASCNLLAYGCHNMGIAPYLRELVLRTRDRGLLAHC